MNANEYLSIQTLRKQPTNCPSQVLVTKNVLEMRTMMRTREEFEPKLRAKVNSN